MTGKPLAADTVFWGPGHLLFEVTNQQDVAVAVRVAATHVMAESEQRLGVMASTVPAKTVTQVRIPATFAAPGEARVRYELVKAATEKLLYGTSVIHTVPDPLHVEPETLVSYLAEDWFRGRWALGLAPEALAGVKLLIELHPVGADRPISSASLVPEATAGSFALNVGGTPAGRYALRVHLLRGEDIAGTTEHPIERFPGPFDTEDIR